MTEADIIWEYRQIAAYDEEQRTGKRYQDTAPIIDPYYEEYQRSLGIEPTSNSKDDLAG